MSKLNMKKVAIVIAACCVLIAPATVASPTITMRLNCRDVQKTFIAKPNVYTLVFGKDLVCRKLRREVMA